MNKKYDDKSVKSAAEKFITTPEPAEDQTTEQPKKKRGRPKKTETTSKDYAPAYTAAKEEEAKRKKEGKEITIINPEADDIESKPSKSVTVTYKKTEVQKPQRKSDRKGTFSTWIDNQIDADIKLYCKISGQKLTDVTEAAFREYMQKYPLTAEQKEDYKRREMERINNI